MKVYHLAVIRDGAEPETGMLVSDRQANLIKEDYDNDTVKVIELVTIEQLHTSMNELASTKSENEGLKRTINAMMANSQLTAGGSGIAPSPRTMEQLKALPVFEVSLKALTVSCPHCHHHQKINIPIAPRMEVLGLNEFQRWWQDGQVWSVVRADGQYYRQQL